MVWLGWFFPTSLCGVLAFGSVSRPPPSARLRPPASRRLTNNLHTYNLHTHTQFVHTTYSHTTCTHTHNLLHTQLTHTQLTQTQLTHTQLTHTQLAHTQLTHTQLTHTQLTQAWHVWHWAGSGGVLGSHVPPWSPRLFAWQAWHLATCSCTLRGSSCTLLTHNLQTHTTYSHATCSWRHGSSLCVAGVARMALGWLWWCAWVSRAAVVAAAFCVAGVALGAAL